MTLEQMRKEFLPPPSNVITKNLSNALDLIEHCSKVKCNECEFCFNDYCTIFPLDWLIDFSAYVKLEDGWHLRKEIEK